MDLRGEKASELLQRAQRLRAQLGDHGDPYEYSLMRGSVTDELTAGAKEIVGLLSAALSCFEADSAPPSDWSRDLRAISRDEAHPLLQVVSAEVLVEVLNNDGRNEVRLGTASGVESLIRLEGWPGEVGGKATTRTLRFVAADRELLSFLDLCIANLGEMASRQGDR